MNDSSNAAGPLSKIDAAVAKLARRCLDESAALIVLLEKLKVPLRSDGTRSKRGAAKVVFKTMLQKGDLERRHEKLVSLERQLAALLLYAIKTSLLQGFEELRDLVERKGRGCVAVVRDSHTVIVEKLTALELGIQTVGQGIRRVEQGVDRVEQGVGKVEEGVGRVEQRQLNDIEQKRVEDLLQSLAYNGMDTRRDMIVDPVGSTYDWAFNDDKQPTKQWLNSTVQHCWISGEPGTGKSVFTKSFRLDRRTNAALHRQSGNDNLLILDHYFWIAGDSQQRSFRAMLQHLCFQVLQQYSALAEVAFPDEWASGVPLRGMGWSITTLVTALKRIIAAAGFQTIITIDGLDECEDKERPALIDLLIDLAKTTSVRFCISSRPWSDFEKAFDNVPRLRLPENNAWDIFQLVCRRLKLADKSTFRDSVDDARLFDITCAWRGSSFLYKDRYKHNQDLLDSPQQLIRDLCVKADGNLLWVTCVLDTISQRLADRQGVAEVQEYILDLPRDLEDYYYALVYGRIHSTYKTGKFSESAMALKIVSCVNHQSWTGRQRFELILALQTSIGTGCGIAYDQIFFTTSLSLETGKSLNHKAHQAVSAFVESRCKDLMTTSASYEDEGELRYRHRVIHDFLSCDRMQSVLHSAVPAHFRAPQFTLHLGILATRKMHECEANSVPETLIKPLDPKAGSILRAHLEIHLENPEGSLDESAMESCSETARSIIRLFTRNDQLKQQLKPKRMIFDPEYDTLLRLALVLVRAQQFDPISDIIQHGCEQMLGHIRQASNMKDQRPRRRCWMGKPPAKLRQVVSTNKQHTGAVDPTTGRAGPYYLLCVHTWWTRLLSTATYTKLEEDVGPVWGHLHAATYVARAFLEAGASLEVELCAADGRCHGHACVCPDPSTHRGLYECPEPSTTQWGEHEHEWISGKSILSDPDHLGIPEAELVQVEARNRSIRSITPTNHVGLARKTEAAWQRHVDSCVRNQVIQVPVRKDKSYYAYLKMAETEGEDDESESEDSEDT